MEINNIITILACIFFIFILGRIFILPLKLIFKLAINSILGGILIYIINFLGSTIGFHIGLNLVTSIFIGILGIPGAVLLIVIKAIISI